MLFYERLAPLNRDAHARLRLRSDGFGFAARTNSAPLLAVELPEAARSFPILFVDIGASQVFPIALLGLRAAENLFVGEDGAWDRDAYVPAFVRRYPFVLAGDMTVLIDEGCPALNEAEGDPLFASEGSNSPLLDTTLGFLRGFQDEVARTQVLIASLTEFELLKPVSLKIVAEQGDEHHLDGLQVVDSDKLAALDDQAVLRLFRSGELAWIQAHIASLAGLDALNRRSAAKMDAAEAETAAAAKTDKNRKRRSKAQGDGM